MAKLTNFRGKRCVIGDVPSLPNEINSLPILSDNENWVGFCKGDDFHPEHFVVVRYTSYKQIVFKKTHWFITNQNKDNSKRVFDRIRKQRCPEGKCIMTLEKSKTNNLGMENVDVLKCWGHVKQKGHNSHYVRVEHGVMEPKIHGKQVGVLVIYIERKVSRNT